LGVAHRDQVLVNEVRSELKGSIAAWIALLAGTGFLAFEFAGRADPLALGAWCATMAVLLTAWFAAWVRFLRHPPSDEQIHRLWIPGARLGMRLANLATAGGVWIFMPAADPEMRALLLVLYAWFLIIQFAAATEATQVLRSAVLLVLGSLTVWLMIHRPPYFVELTVFMALFGATLLAIRRFVRQAVVQATEARAAAEAARQELAVALVGLERERDAKTHFIRAASHDLQQPLQAAALFLGGLKSGARSAETAKSLDGLRRSLGVARILVNSMLDHLKLDSGAIEADLSDFPARDLFDRIALTQGPAAAMSGIRLRFVAGRIMLRSDPLLLARAVENLVANAIRHSGGRRIVVGARARKAHVAIWVVDDGCGLAPDDEERIFRPFEQGSHVGPKGGFGLGLASVQRLVAIVGGDCGVAPGRTRGAAFYIRLPSSVPADEARCAA
jgi:signal transduction histidine kinase